MTPEQPTAAVFDLGHMVSGIGQVVAEIRVFLVGPHAPQFQQPLPPPPPPSFQQALSAPPLLCTATAAAAAYPYRMPGYGTTLLPF
jgi:hypothetical protein